MHTRTLTSINITANSLKLVINKNKKKHSDRSIEHKFTNTQLNTPALHRLPLPPPPHHHALPSSSGVTSRCTRGSLTVDVSTEEAFFGSVYARGYPSSCREVGLGNTSTSLVVPAQKCGVKVIEDEVRAGNVAMT